MFFPQPHLHFPHSDSFIHFLCSFSSILQHLSPIWFCSLEPVSFLPLNTSQAPSPWSCTLTIPKLLIPPVPCQELTQYPLPSHPLHPLNHSAPTFAHPVFCAQIMPHNMAFPSLMLMCFQISQSTQIFLPRLQNSLSICLIILSTVTVCPWNVHKKVNFHKLVLTVMHQHPSPKQSELHHQGLSRQSALSVYSFLKKTNDCCA